MKSCQLGLDCVSVLKIFSYFLYHSTVAAQDLRVQCVLQAPRNASLAHRPRPSAKSRQKIRCASQLLQPEQSCSLQCNFFQTFENQSKFEPAMAWVKASPCTEKLEYISAKSLMNVACTIDIAAHYPVVDECWENMWLMHQFSSSAVPMHLRAQN